MGAFPLLVISLALAAGCTGRGDLMAVESRGAAGWRGKGLGLRWSLKRGLLLLYLI